MKIRAFSVALERLMHFIVLPNPKWDSGFQSAAREVTCYQSKVARRVFQDIFCRLSPPPKNVVECLVFSRSYNLSLLVSVGFSKYTSQTTKLNFYIKIIGEHIPFHFDKTKDTHLSVQYILISEKLWNRTRVAQIDRLPDLPESTKEQCSSARCSR
jgi:hypothetical protein